MTSTSAPIYNGRYELSHQIARGGTAQVYLARDLLLDRPVALKVLFPELSSDHTFVERFRREAQAAANLSHPNIVPVFDWGESERTYFIVMEYVDGEPLSAIIRGQAPLAPAQAASIAADIAKALAYAHRHGVVHRDVKPGNVLITTDGQVKVTDFGIARAIGTDENVTQTGLVMGTATYFSPEQAQGHGVDGRSDVYSLGVVLYEMVTGRPPFSADTPVAIAYKHVSEVPPSPRSLVPAVPRDLEAVIGKAMAKDPALRYQTAQELQADLERFVRGQPVLAAIGAGTAAAAAAVAGGAAAGLAAATAPGTAGAGVGGTATGATQVLGALGTTATLPTAEQGDARGGAAAPREPELPKRRVLPWAAAAVLLLVALGAIVYSGGRALGYFGSGGYFVVPAVTGSQVSSARAELTRAGLRVAVEPVHSAEPVGTVVRQQPAPPTRVRRGDLVTLEVSTGPTRVPLPDVRGLQLALATAELRADGFKVQVLDVAPPGPGIPQGQVVGESPAPTGSVPVGTVVTLQVVSGKALVKVPAIPACDSETDAAAKLGAAGLTPAAQTVSQPSSTCAAGTVIGTEPPTGQAVPLNTAVTLVVSSGPPVTVPYVIGDTPAQAEQALLAAGCNYSVVDAPPPSPSLAGLVWKESPSSGTSVGRGTTVTITVGTGAPPPSSTTATSTSTSSTTATSTSTTAGGLPLG
jgi:beta-lactam-binding protein with PASTA domain/tRNA A-37 threonylcarbamoyl transferase component Bud32